MKPRAAEHTRVPFRNAVAVPSNGIRRGSCREGANRSKCEAYGSGMTSQIVGFGAARTPRSIFSLSAFAK